MKKILSCVLAITILFSALAVSAAAETKQTFAEYYGFSYESYIAYLKSHENDSYYLGTTYHNGNWRSPNGDPSYNGAVGMNCSGFVWHVIQSVIRLNGGNPSDYDIPCYTSPKNWMRIMQDHNIEYYVFDSVWELLNSGKLQQGDLIMCWATDSFVGTPKNHIGIYWGDGTTDVFWHSAFGRNHISNIRSGGPIVKIGIGKMGHRTATLEISLKNDDGKALSGIDFGVYDSNGAKKYGGTTDKKGKISLTGLAFGTYTVKQLTKKDNCNGSKPQTVTLSSGNFSPSLSFTNKLRRSAITVRIGAKSGKNILPVGDTEGRTVVLYGDKECTKFIDSGTTNALGDVTFGVTDGKYTLKPGTNYYANFGGKVKKIRTYAGRMSSATFSYEVGAGIRVPGTVDSDIEIYLEEGHHKPLLCTASVADGAAMNLTSATVLSDGYAYFGVDFEWGSKLTLSGGVYYLYDRQQNIDYKCNADKGVITDAATGEKTMAGVRCDVTCDGRLTAADARILLRQSAGLENLNADLIRLSDIDNNGKITAAEARLVLRYAAGLIG